MARPMASLRRLASGRLFWAALLLAPTLACAKSEVGETAVFLKIDMHPDSLEHVPDAVEVAWFDARRLLTKRRVPEIGSLTRGAKPLATVVITTPDAPRDPKRRVVVRGLTLTGKVVAYGGEVMVSPNEWIEVPLSLSHLPPEDDDGDFVPNGIDRCPGNDFEGCDVAVAPASTEGSAGPLD